MSESEVEKQLRQERSQFDLEQARASVQGAHHSAGLYGVGIMEVIRRRGGAYQYRTLHPMAVSIHGECRTRGVPAWEEHTTGGVQSERERIAAWHEAGEPIPDAFKGGYADYIRAGLPGWDG